MSRRRKVGLMLSAGAVGLSAAHALPTLAQKSAPGAVAERHVRAERQTAQFLQTSEAMKQAIVEEEGARATVYRGASGALLVGIGHLVTPADGLAPGDRIDEQHIMMLFERDIARAERAVTDMVGDLPLHQHEYDALVDLVFNVGEGTAGPGSSPRLHAAIAAGDYGAIARELHYAHAGGGAIGALQERSERRMQIFLAGAYSGAHQV